MREAICCVVRIEGKGGREMIKRIIAIVAALAMCVPMIARAETVYHYGDAVLDTDSGNIEICGLDELDSETYGVILAGYDGNGSLVGSQYLTVENDECIGKEINGAASYKMTRINDFESDFTELNVIKTSSDSKIAPAASEAPTTSEAPTVSAVPAATKAPSATNAPHYPPYAATPPPPPYERSLDSYFTFAVVKNVSSATGDNGPEYIVDVLREGREDELHVPTDAEVVASSDYYSYMTGADASSLQEGDIVYFERNNAGTEVTAMAFMYRPVNENIMTSTENYGADFERLFSAKGRVYGSPTNEPGTVIHYGKALGRDRYQYAFGAVLEKGNGYFTLINRSGVTDNAIEIATTKDTIVYTCDMSARRDALNIENQAAIKKSGIPQSEYDDDGKITFSDDWDYAYAFARVVNGVATEVVIYY